MGYLDDLQAKNKPTFVEKTVAKNRERVKAVSWLTMHSSAIFVTLLLLVGTICALVAEFNLDNSFDIKEVTISGIIFSAVVYSIFIECTNNGKKQYLEGVESLTTEDEYNVMIKEIEELNLAGKIETFCELYVQEKLDKARKRVLSRSKLTLEDYNHYLFEEGEFTPKQLKTLKKAHKLKPIKLNEEMIYHASADYEDGSPIRSRNGIIAYIAGKYIYKLISSVLSMFFTISIGYDLIMNLTPEVILRTVLQGVIMVGSIFGGLKFGIIQMQKWNDQKKDIIRVLKTFRRWEKQGKLDKVAVICE